MIEKILLDPIFLTRLLCLKRDVYEKVGDFSAEVCVSDEPIPKDRWEACEFVPFEKGKTWTKKKYGCCVFRLNGEVPQSASGKKIVAVLKLGAEAEIYRDGRPVCAVTPILSTIDVGQPLLGKQTVALFDPAQGGEKVELYADCGHNGYCGVFLYDPRLVKADLAVENTEIKDYYYDYLFLLLTLVTKRKNRYLTAEWEKEIKQALSHSYALYKKGDVEGARKLLLPLMNTEQTQGVVYTAIGHGHLDLAWRWPIREGKRKAVRTFSNVINALDRYEFTFGASQAQLFQWVEEQEKELFDRIREEVAKGTIEIQGGMWTECDCNVPSGESLIRQFLYGGEYFEGKFGKNSDVAWLPDTFGFPQTLPQILAGCGKKYFMTIKLNWNEENEFPYQSFHWVAPDGSKVLAHFAPEGTYACSASPIAFVKSDVKYKQKETENALVIYGVSDGGGGPGEGHLEMAKRAGKAFVPQARLASSESFFERLSQKPMPEYRGELYLEKHRGTLTSQSDNKYYNRYAERKLHDLEWLESVTGNKEKNRDELWKKLLTNQFHDILPGSAIHRVHQESVEELLWVCENAERATEERIVELSKGKGLYVLNPAPFAVREKRVFDGELYQVECEAYSSAEAVKTSPSFLSVGEDDIENEFLKVTFDRKTGKIVSVIDKTTGEEKGKGVFHALTIYNDPKGFYDAWDIDRSYLKKKRQYPMVVSFATKTTLDRAEALIEYSYGRTTILQEVYIKDSKQIIFETQIEWNEKHKMLRADFCPSFYSEQAEFDVQFGSILRSTENKTKEDKAKFEVCGHYYASVGEEGNGYFAVLNRGKYGYRAKDGEISLNLLRAPTVPDPKCDRGSRFVTYAADFCDGKKEVVQKGYLFNNPILVTKERVEIRPPIRFANEDLIIETIKLAEDEGIVVRVYERYGQSVETEFTLEKGGTVCETDLLERNAVPVDKLVFRPYEIKTLLIR